MSAAGLRTARELLEMETMALRTSLSWPQAHEVLHAYGGSPEKDCSFVVPGNKIHPLQLESNRNGC